MAKLMTLWTCPSSHSPPLLFTWTGVVSCPLPVSLSRLVSLETSRQAWTGRCSGPSLTEPVTHSVDSQKLLFPCVHLLVFPHCPRGLITHETVMRVLRSA